MREIRLSGSVEGVVSDHDPYSDSGEVEANTQNLLQMGRPFILRRTDPLYLGSPRTMLDNRRRRGRREGVWPKGTCPSKTRPGHRAGRTRRVRWSGYVKQQERISSCGSRRSCTTSTTWKRCAGLTSD